ncbi:MAG TPA: hypothetical protein VGJ20_09260 [Xanthobacteraceae bacterium]
MLTRYLRFVCHCLVEGLDRALNQYQLVAKIIVEAVPAIFGDLRGDVAPLDYQPIARSFQPFDVLIFLSHATSVVSTPFPNRVSWKQHLHQTSVSI